MSLAAAFLVTFPEFPKTSSDAKPEKRAGAMTFLTTLALPTTWISMALFFIYCGLESGTGLWIASALHDGRGWTMEGASLMATLYWGSLTVGRFLIGTVSQRTTPTRITRIASVGAFIGTSIIALSSMLANQFAWAGLMTAVGLLFTGLSLSPIFPMLTHDTPRCVGQDHALNLIGLQMGSGVVGYTILPIVIGTVMRVHSTDWLGSMLTVLAVSMLALLVVRDRLASSRENMLGSPPRPVHGSGEG
jgi:fucose permease